MRTKLPPPQGYPQQLLTIGDHVRKRRMDLGLTQTQAAKRLRVCSSTVLLWELCRARPLLRFMPRIWAFLGQEPQADVPMGGGSARRLTQLGERIRRARLARFLTQKQLAQEFAVDPSTVQGWEIGRHIPQQVRLRRLLEEFIARVHVKS